MIFAPDLAAKVLDGTKTQTRRLTKLLPSTPEQRYVFAPCRYAEGRIYAVQTGRGQPSVGRLRVVSVARTTVSNISREDAKAEGFTGTTAFYDRWREMYGHTGGWCWRIEFVLDSPGVQGRE